MQVHDLNKIKFHLKPKFYITREHILSHGYEATITLPAITTDNLCYEGHSTSNNENQCITLKMCTFYISVKCTFSKNTYELVADVTSL